MQHHAYVIEGGVEGGIVRAEQFIAEKLDMKARGNADVIILRYGLLSTEEARSIAGIAASAPIAGDKKAIVIAAARVYHEAQNALLKIFEEPPPGTYLFLVLPNLGSLLSTLKSRVVILDAIDGAPSAEISEAAKKFLKMDTEKRSVLIKKLATGKDEEERRENRDEALAILNGIEAVAYGKLKSKQSEELIALLKDISLLRSYLYDRSAPVRMILEHVSLTLPSGLV